MYAGHFHHKWPSLILFAITLDLFFPMSLPLPVAPPPFLSLMFWGLCWLIFCKQHQLESLGKKELLRYRLHQIGRWCIFLTHD